MTQVFVVQLAALVLCILNANLVINSLVCLHEHSGPHSVSDLGSTCVWNIMFQVNRYHVSTQGID